MSPRPNHASLLVALSFWSWALQATHAAPGERHALIICNQNYTHVGALRTTLAEAREAEKTLSTLGFAGNITTVTDATTVEMNKAVDAFAVKAADAEVAFFFYGGHAVQAAVDSREENFLLGIDSSPASASQLVYDAVPMGRVLGELEESGSKLKLLVLDCCRDNPLPARARSIGSTRGLAPVSRAPTGTLIAYAADAGQQAWDDHGEIGLYGSVLFHIMKTPGLRLEDIFIATRKEVSRIAREAYQHEQEPAEYVKVDSPFYFLPGVASAAGAALAPMQIPPVPMPARPAVLAPTATRKPVTLSTEDRERIIKAESELASVEAKISFEQRRWKDNNAIINKLTSNRRSPVQQGSFNHRVCVQAGVEMDDAAAKAPVLLARKKELEALISAIRETPSSETPSDETKPEN